MDKLNLFLLISAFIVLTQCENQKSVALNNNNESNREFYQLKTYTFDSAEQISVTDEYLKNAFLPALKKQGLYSIGVFKNLEKDSLNKTYVLIPFSSMDQFLSYENIMFKDESYLKTGKNYINATKQKPPYKRVESTLLQAFNDMPKMKVSSVGGPRKNRIYELRSYESSTEKYNRNKVDMFNAGGEINLFDKLNFNAVFYGEVLAGSKMPNLMYMTSFENKEKRDELWKSFGESPEWKEMSNLPKYQNNMSHADIMLLYPTDYSDY